ncbi:hypothetical protein PFICI_12665 [Pestalotiopsis fici W106-1]|uniref:Uncharacterized protein n=1 Tax=Pestalotiopsis fici (strain W106-1 / CGMCC3.15140) TaxID=1229662 RepID=W3WSC4_PESFW|nr:uncharacterized protein PFICI_12665 [Pestalotiopsis fici W106-1]ETS75721.1 hypothetical protein PFICI_12665 [Pestalotiopsis fici W106-1]
MRSLAVSGLCLFVIFRFSHRQYGQSDSVDDGDICLERLAGDLLSEWFGIEINSLERPIRVLHCLEQVKGQMAAVVEEEGHVLAEDRTEYPETDDMLDVDAADDQPYSGGNPSQFAPHRHSQGGEASGQSGTNKKRLNNGDLKSSIPSGLKATTRYPKKKRRTGLNLSCPYRKRDPCRFNAQQYERCALR